MGARELVLPLEDAGRFGVPEPLIETASIAIPALIATSNGRARDRWLARLVSGESVATVSMNAAPYAPYAGSADLFLVEDGDTLFAVPAEAVEVTAKQSVDHTRRLGAVSADLHSSGVENLGSSTVARQWALFGTSAFLVGLGQQMLDLAVEYAKVRTQFGKAIGTFQAVQHRLADARLALEFARPMVYRAANSLDTTDPDIDQHVALAKVMASEAATTVAKASLQVHGAIGYSTEYDLHLYMKRAWALANAHGSASDHREHLIQTIVQGA
jgi:alkylation response protein AidB-like acyl-CoA dehydrogenase